MYRLQVSLTEDQVDFLKSEAFGTGQSMAAVLRQVLDEAIEKRRQQILRDDTIWEVVGVAAEVEGPTDISRQVDRYLYGEAAEPAGQQPRAKRVAEDSYEYPAD